MLISISIGGSAMRRRTAAALYYPSVAYAYEALKNIIKFVLTTDNMLVISSVLRQAAVPAL